MKRIKFYKEGTEWYADVPNHSQAENRMVAGADKFLDSLDDKHTGLLCLCVGEDDNHGDYVYSLFRLHHDKWGATYLLKKKRSRLGLRIVWLCNVVHDVLGKHPKHIYIYNNPGSLGRRPQTEEKK